MPRSVLLMTPDAGLFHGLKWWWEAEQISNGEPGLNEGWIQSQSMKCEFGRWNCRVRSGNCWGSNSSAVSNRRRLRPRWMPLGPRKSSRGSRRIAVARCRRWTPPGLSNGSANDWLRGTRRDRAHSSRGGRGTVSGGPVIRRSPKKRLWPAGKPGWNEDRLTRFLR